MYIRTFSLLRVPQPSYSKVYHSTSSHLVVRQVNAPPLRAAHGSGYVGVTGTIWDIYVQHLERCITSTVWAYSGLSRRTLPILSSSQNRKEGLRWGMSAERLALSSGLKRRSKREETLTRAGGCEARRTYNTAAMTTPAKYAFS